MSTSAEAELTDESILIRPYREPDAPLLYAAVRESIPEVSPWLPWCHENYSIEESLPQALGPKIIDNSALSPYSPATLGAEFSRALLPCTLENPAHEMK